MTTLLLEFKDGGVEKSVMFIKDAVPSVLLASVGCLDAVVATALSVVVVVSVVAAFVVDNFGLDVVVFSLIVAVLVVEGKYVAVDVSDAFVAGTGL